MFELTRNEGLFIFERRIINQNENWKNIKS